MKPFPKLLRLIHYFSQGMQDAGALKERCSQPALLPTNQLGLGSHLRQTFAPPVLQGGKCLPTAGSYANTHCYLELCLFDLPDLLLLIRGRAVSKKRKLFKKFLKFVKSPNSPYTLHRRAKI